MVVVWPFLLCVVLVVVDVEGLLSDCRLKCLVVVWQWSQLYTLSNKFYSRRNVHEFYWHYGGTSKRSLLAKQWKRICKFTIFRAVASPWTLTPTERDPKLKPVVEAMPSRTMIANMLFVLVVYEYGCRWLRAMMTERWQQRSMIGREGKAIGRECWVMIGRCIMPAMLSDHHSASLPCSSLLPSVDSIKLRDGISCLTRILYP